MAEVAVIMVGDAAKLLAENEKLIRKQGQLEDKLKKSQDRSKEAAEQAKKEAEAKAKVIEVERKAKALIESMATPQERYNTKLREAEMLEKKGAISTEILSRRKKQLKEELRNATLAQSSFNTQMQSVASSVETITSMATAYVGIQAAVTAVTGSLQQQIDLQKESLDLVVKTGKAQQDAIKNLTGLSEDQKREALNSAIEIQQATGFAGRDQLINAIGAGFSASGDIAATKDAVEAAAQLSRLTPEAVAGISSGALDIQRGSGVADAESNLGFLLQAGSFARIEDPTLLSKNLAPVVGSSSTIFAQGNQQQVAKESAALFAALSRAGTDKTGESTSTATIQLNQQLAEFFRGSEQAPSTPLEAIKILQENQALREEFTANLQGEARFKDAFRALFDVTSTVSKEAFSTAGQLKFDRSVFDQTVGQLTNLTPEIAIAGIEAGARADSETAKTNINRAAVGAINQIAGDVLPQVRPGGVAGAVQAVVGGINEQFVPSIYNDPQSLAQFRVGQFEARKSALEAGGVTANEAPLVRLLEQSIERVNAVLATLDQKLGGAADKLGEAGDKLKLPPQIRPMLGPSPGPNVTHAARNQINQGEGF